VVICLHSQDVVVRQGSDSHRRFTFIPSSLDGSPNECLKLCIEVLFALHEPVLSALF